MIDSRKAYDTIQAFLKRNPVRAEQTGERNLEFSQWLRRHCRPSKRGCKLEYLELGCLVAFDLDFVLYDYTRKMVQLLEVKTRNGVVRFSQGETLHMLDGILTVGAQKAGIKYLGLHVLRMDGLQPFTSSRILWDDEPITGEECWRKINMLDYLDGAAGD